MPYDTPPSKETWDSRLNWLEEQREEYQHPMGSYLVSEQACALSMDLYSAFCGGAWISVIILAHAICDATIRDTETLDYRSSSSEQFGDDSDLHWLRKTRNRLTHVKKDDPAITVDDLWLKDNQFEADARKAVQIMFRIMFDNPGT